MDNNKLIAEFMEVPTEVFKSGIMNYYHDGAWYEEHELSYDVCWEWLMPVVEKTKDMGYDQELDNIDNVLTCDLSRENLYKAVVEFIKKI